MNAVAAPSAGPVSFYITGGTLPREASSYVTRRADTNLYSHLMAGEYCYILDSRQMGKSSLMVHTAERLEAAGSTIAVLDLTAIGQNLAPEQWYDGLLSRLGRQLRLEDQLDDFYESNFRLSPLQRFFEAIQQVVLPYIPNRLILFVDEIDAVRSLPFSADEFFAGIRQCFVARAHDARLSRLVFCLLGTATPANLIRDTRISPFNIGTRIDIQDFTAEEAASLAEGLGPQGPALLKRVLYWTGGHPYLTQRLCRAAADHHAASSPDVDKLCSELFLTHAAREGDDNLTFVRNRLLNSEVELAALLDVYSKLRRGQRVADDETDPLTSVLKLSGVARVTAGCLKIRNRIYDHVFDRPWVLAHMPGAELQRQKAAYRKGLVRAVALSSIVVAAMAMLLFYAQFQKQAARSKTEEAQDLTSQLSAALLHSQENARQAAFYAAPQERAANIAKKSEARATAAVRQRDTALRKARFEQGLAEKSARAEHKAGEAARIAAQKASTAAGTAVLAQHVASEQAAAAHRALYIADMNLVQQAWEATPIQVWRVLELLNETRASKERAFEWDYWNRLSHQELYTFAGGHKEGITSAALSPDGNTLLTGSYDHTAVLWSTRTGQKIFVLHGHTGPILSVAFSPDGRRLFTGSYDRTGRLWDAQSGRLTFVIDLRGTVYSVAFSPDSKVLLTGGGHARLWNAQNGRLLGTLTGKDENVSAVAFSHDGRRILTGRFDGISVLWNTDTRTEVMRLPGHVGRIRSVAFSMDNKHIITGSEDTTARLWDAGTGQCLRELTGHTGYVETVAVSPDGTRLLTGSDDNTARVWDAGTGRLVHTIKGHSAPVLSAAFSADGTRILTGSDDKTAKLWDSKLTGDPISLTGHSGKIRSLAVSPDGQHVLTGDDKSARLWDFRTGREVCTLDGVVGPVYSVAFSRDGTRFLTCGNHVTLWDLTTCREVLPLPGQTGPARFAAFSPDSNTIFASGVDGALKLWDAHTGFNMPVRLEQAGKVHSAAFSPDGKYILVVTNDKTARLWNYQTGQEALSFRRHGANVSCVAYSPDGTGILLGNFDRTAKLVDIRSGREVLLKGHAQGVISVAFSPDGRRVLTGSDDQTARIWDPQTGREVLTLRAHTGSVTTVAFSKDCKHILTGSSDKTIRIWSSEMATSRRDE